MEFALYCEISTFGGILWNLTKRSIIDVITDLWQTVAICFKWLHFWDKPHTHTHQQSVTSNKMVSKESHWCIQVECNL